MTVKDILRAGLCWLALAPLLARGEDARLPYHEIYSIQRAQMALSRAHTNLALVLQMHSTEPDVKNSDITASIEAKSGPIPVPIGSNGVFSLPMSADLLAEDPWIHVNQPRGTMELKCLSGLAPALARQMTNNAHYSPLMRAARECDEVQESMRQFFPGAPRLTAVGLRLTFRSAAVPPQVVLRVKSGDRKMKADALGDLIIPLDGDLMEEDPIMTMTENPVAVEIVTQKYGDAP